MTFFQNGYYELLFLVNDSSGQPLAALNGALFVMRQRGVDVVSYTLADANMSFSVGLITIELSDTADLVGPYDYELWAIVNSNEKHLLRKDKITFDSTYGRIE